MKNNKRKGYCLLFLFITAILFNSYVTPVPAADNDENVDTYSIDLMQTAEIAKEIVNLDNKKVLTETYVAKDGDHIWKILRNKEVFAKNKLGDVISILKKLNPSLSNLDLIHPGEKIIIPLIITPVTQSGQPEKTDHVVTVSLEEAENLEYYTVRPGDSLVRVLSNKYSIPQNELYNEYFDQLKKLNPELKNLNNIYPGQKVRLPVYSPKVVRGVISENTKKPKPDSGTLRIINKEKGDHLKKIFALIGEEWVDQGKHFIPLKTGGQIDLNTETYPIINLRSGDRVIVDLYNNLPEKMSHLIMSDWDSYRILHITEDDDLTATIAKAISACNYEKVYSSDESLVFEEGFKIELTADWIIRLLPESSPGDINIICLNLAGKEVLPFPSTLKKYLLGHGIKIIYYPETLTEEDISSENEIISLNGDRNSIIEKILDLAGQSFSSRLDIPIHKEEDSDFNLVIKADFYFNRKGKDFIIDLNGIGDDIINLLKEHSYSVLSVTGNEDPYKLTEKMLGFLGIDFVNNEHIFYAIPGNSKGNAKLIIPGILFNDEKGKSNFFTSVYLNPDISMFIAAKIDNIFHFVRPKEAEKNGRQDTSN